MPARKQTGTEGFIQGIRNDRVAFREVFTKGYGPQVLAWIGNECGAFSQKPEAVKPELVSFWNRLLGQVGIIHPLNLVGIAEKLLEASNDDDLVDIRRQAAKNEEETQE